METLLSPSGTREQISWGDGSGTVEHILALPFAPEALATFPLFSGDSRLNVSIARIVRRETGFSHFPGMDRVHLLLSGECLLTVAGEVVQLTGRYPLQRFSGEVPTSCMLLGESATAFTIVHDRDVAVAVELHELPGDEGTTVVRRLCADATSELEKPSQWIEVVYVVRGSCEVVGLPEQFPTLGPDDAVVMLSSDQILSQLRLSGEASVIVARFRISRK